MSLEIFGISDYLLIKLVNVIVGLPLGLDIDGMTLNTVSCGHDWLSTRRTKKTDVIRFYAEPRVTRDTNRTRVSRWGVEEGEEGE